MAVDIPEEICDLNPQKTCHMATKMVPKLTPEHECTRVPQEVCHLTYGPPQVVAKPFKSEWCLDEEQPRESRRGRQRPLFRRPKYRGFNNY